MKPGLHQHGLTSDVEMLTKTNRRTRFSIVSCEMGFYNTVNICPLIYLRTIHLLIFTQSQHLPDSAVRVHNISDSSLQTSTLSFLSRFMSLPDAEFTMFPVNGR